MSKVRLLSQLKRYKKRQKVRQLNEIQQLKNRIEQFEKTCGTLIYCTALACVNNNQLSSCPEGQGLCSNETIHLQGCTPDADNVFGCSEFAEQALKGEDVFRGIAIGTDGKCRVVEIEIGDKND